ncbi:MAG: SDR family NAD(P)-dependent oxidoreductase [Actinomycetes bacterium]
MTTSSSQTSGPPPARTALVSGASRGIGRFIAVGLAEAGLNVALLARNAKALADAAEEVRAVGVHAVPVAADVTELGSVQDAVAEVREAIGQVDLLVNNAGRIESTEVVPWEADPFDWWAVVQTNLRGAFHLVRTVVPGMVEAGGGRVVDLSTGSALYDSDIYSAYHASKSALLRFGSGLALAGREHRLLSFELAPGVVRTDMTGSMPVHDDRTEWNDPGDVVGLVQAIARGELDAWSGRFLRAGSDDVATLRKVAQRGLQDDARRLVLQPYGDDDPLA